MRRVFVAGGKCDVGDVQVGIGQQAGWESRGELRIVVTVGCRPAVDAGLREI
jgi:hypothetical protein